MRFPALCAAAALAALSACTTVSSRIKSDQTAFDASAPEAQALIRNGQAAVGFTKEQVVMALGHPNRVYEKKTPAADEEIWVYGVDDGPGFGLAPEYGGGGIVVSNAYFEENERVVFEKGKAVSVVKRVR
jgi:hypothetical protein